MQCDSSIWYCIFESCLIFLLNKHVFVEGVQKRRAYLTSLVSLSIIQRSFVNKNVFELTPHRCFAHLPMFKATVILSMCRFRRPRFHNLGWGTMTWVWGTISSSELEVKRRCTVDLDLLPTSRHSGRCIAVFSQLPNHVFKYWPSHWCHECSKTLFRWWHDSFEKQRLRNVLRSMLVAIEIHVSRMRSSASRSQSKPSNPGQQNLSIKRKTLLREVVI